MHEADSSLFQAVIARLSAHFLLQPTESGTGEITELASRWSGLALRAYDTPGTMLLMPVPQAAEPWTLTLRFIGSARNWFTAEIDNDRLNADAISLLHRIDQALEGLLSRALYGREIVLAERRNELISHCHAMLDEHARVQRLAHTLDYAWGGVDHHRSDTPLTAAWKSLHALDAVGGFAAGIVWDTASGAFSTPIDFTGDFIVGHRFYLECTVHGFWAEDAAVTLANGLATALENGTISGTIEPIDRAKTFLTNRMHAAFHHSLDAPGGAGTRPAAGTGPSHQAATERLGL